MNDRIANAKLEPGETIIEYELPPWVGACVLIVVFTLCVCGTILVLEDVGWCADDYSTINPYALSPNTIIQEPNQPKVYDNQGRYRGSLSPNPYNSDSIQNPYGTYGNRYSNENLNGPYSPRNQMNPVKPFGGRLYGEDER